ncbi:MAG: peroxide stress protein YaaA [Actinomycetales bacterium]|nr:peroxide stress protein YaaA [Actinomycetales bacterium]
MRILLPPSETKRPGGDPESRLDWARLAFARALTGPRRAVARALREVSRVGGDGMRALRLGATLESELALNRAVLRSPVMPALDRFDGVLYDALAAASLAPSARERAARRVLIASALFGLVGALDPIPAYRLGADARLPDLRLRAHWGARLPALLAALPGPLLDLRSEAYRDLGPVPDRPDAAYLRVLTEGPDGRRRPLNHFNKHAKGAFTRAVLEAERGFDTLDDLVAWARGAGWNLEPGDPGELRLVIPPGHAAAGTA